MTDPAAIQATASGSWFEAKLTLDGLMTLAGGVIAFIAVVLQNRNTRLQVDRQLRAEKEARTQQENERRRAVARALLVEIDGFYVHHLIDARRVLTEYNPQTNALPSFTSEASEENPFPVYVGNTSGIGTLDQDGAARVVHFYSVANTFFAIIKALENRRQNRDNLQVQVYVGLLKKYTAEAIQLGCEACRVLSDLCGVLFIPQRVGIAVEENQTEAGSRQAQGLLA